MKISKRGLEILEIIHEIYETFKREMWPSHQVLNVCVQVHMNLHNDVKPFACDTCGRQFAQLGNLQKHMSVHTGERPHRCSECTRCFSDLSALRRHYASIHERNPRYHCETCGKKFLHLSSARSHRMQHDGVKPHYCTVCGKTFTHRSGWMRHCRVHHHKDHGVVRARVGEDSKEVLLKPGEYIVYLTEWTVQRRITNIWLSNIDKWVTLNNASDQRAISEP